MPKNRLHSDTDSGAIIDSVLHTSPTAFSADQPDRLLTVDHVLDRLRGAYADNTIRAYKSDFEIFSRWCYSKSFAPLPAAPEVISAFIEAEMKAARPATICRRISSISRIHRLSEHGDPTTSDTVRLALRRMHRAKGRRQKQALGLTADLRDKLIDAASNDIQGARDRALVSLAYDTLRRRSELVALRIGDLEAIPQGGAVIFVRRSKTDQEGIGKLAYISPMALDYCLDWVRQAKIEEGSILRSVTRNGNIGQSLYPGSIGRIYKRLARTAGMPENMIEKISGHSTRVGAAQDMAAAGIDILAIMQAGGWKSPEIVARYVEKLDVLRGGGFQLANLQIQKMSICEPSPSGILQYSTAE